MTKTLSALMIGVTLLATASQIVSASTALSAGARVCRMTTYYKDSEMTTVVGVRTTCPGGRSYGRTSPYYEVEVVELDSGGGSGGPSTGPGKLPCEFLAAGCSNLPVLR